MWIWLGLAVLALIGEAMSGKFYLLLTLGLAAGGIGALSGFDEQWQFVITGVVILVGLLALWLTNMRKKREVDASSKR